eukprot:scaffold3933_cov98-Cylindrotheca_fusiformis.AAC.2
MATIEEIEKLLSEKLSEALGPVNEKLDLLLAGKVAFDGEAIAKQATVAIRSCPSHSSNKAAPMGHGLLIKAATDGDGKTAIYLMSAAHVVVDIVGTKLQLSWPGASNSSSTADNFITVTAKKLFLDERYVKCGSHDIGLLEVSLDNDERSGLYEHNLGIVSGNVELGNVLVGQGHVYLRGQLVHHNPETSQVMIQAISVPGCSGCPLFQNDKKLVAFVHGKSKHRHHSNSDIHEPSNAVFADVFLDFQFREVKGSGKIQKLLQEAEGLTPEEAEKPNENYCVVGPACPPTLKRLVFSLLALGEDGLPQNAMMKAGFSVDDDAVAFSNLTEFSIDFSSVMKVVAKVVFEGKEILDFRQTALNYLSPVTPVHPQPSSSGKNAVTPDGKGKSAER